MNAEFNKFYSELGENNFRNVLLPESMAKNTYEQFSLYMPDDSMSGTIELGDRVIVNARKPLNIGDIILFFYHDELLIRRLISNDLKANNKNYADIPVKNVEYFLGKVTTRITDLEN